MLTAELVRARKRAGRLTITPLSDAQARRACEMAEALLELTRQHQARTRGELGRAVRELVVAAQDRKLALGLAKLVEDRCEFAEEASLDAAELRSRVFSKASLRRSSLEAGSVFDRQALIAEVGAELGLSPDALERALYSDLHGSHVLLRAPSCAAAELVNDYERAQRQAVLLRAVKVRVDVRCRLPADYRTLFRKLKFRRLLYSLTALSGGGYRVEIDGPFSLFESVTKYGLQLALLLPALEACDELSLSADVLWGKRRERLTFEYETQKRMDTADEELAPVPDEVAGILRGVSEMSSGVRVRVSDAIIDLPGVGLCVPDLEFEYADTGEVAYLEVLGFWSRDAVWKRVELVERGLTEKILFAVSSRLRVSEAVLDDEQPSALYVYKGSISARSVLGRLEELRRRPARSRRASKSG